MRGRHGVAMKVARRFLMAPNPITGRATIRNKFLLNRCHTSSCGDDPICWHGMLDGGGHRGIKADPWRCEKISSDIKSDICGHGMPMNPMPVSYGAKMCADRVPNRHVYPALLDLLSFGIGLVVAFLDTPSHRS